MGLVPAACDRVGETTGGAAHDVRRDQRVSQCRGGLAPTASLARRAGWSGGVAAARGGRVPWVAMAGSQVWPVVMTACRWRRIAAAMTVWAWVGGELVVLAAGQVPVAGGVDGVGALGSPDRPPGGEPQSGPALSGQFGAADERAGQFLPGRQAGVFDQRAGGGEPARVAGLGQDRRGADRVRCR